MKGHYFMLSMLLLFFSCTDGKVEEYYSSGNLRYIEKDSIATTFYDTIPSIPFKREFKFKTHDSIVWYYKKGNVFKCGKQNKEGRKFGNWSLFRKDRYLSNTTEYFIINGETISNRFWYFNKQRDTIWYAGKFNFFYDQGEFRGDTLGARHSTMIDFNIYTKDTLSLDKPFLASVICNSPLGREHDSQIIMLLAKEEHNFNDHFSNESTVKLDTFYNLVKDVKNRPNFTYSEKPEESHRYIVAFGRRFKKPGRKVLRGYMLEYYTFDSTATGFSRGESRVYFEKEIFVKE